MYLTMMAKQEMKCESLPKVIAVARSVLFVATMYMYMYH